MKTENHYETFGDALRAINQLYLDLLYVDEDKPTTLPPKQPMAEQFYLIAVEHIQMAKRNMQLASYNYMQGR